MCDNFSFLFLFFWIKGRSIIINDTCWKTRLFRFNKLIKELGFNDSLFTPFALRVVVYFKEPSNGIKIAYTPISFLAWIFIFGPLEFYMLCICRKLLRNSTVQLLKCTRHISWGFEPAGKKDYANLSIIMLVRPFFEIKKNYYRALQKIVL